MSSASSDKNGDVLLIVMKHAYFVPFCAESYLSGIHTSTAFAEKVGYNQATF